MSRLDAARAYFARREDPYAGGDIGNARRLGSVLWWLVVVLIVVLWIPSPPTEAIGKAGWIPAAALALGGVVVGVLMRRGRLITSWGRILATAYGAVFAIAVLQWLAGGIGSPYERVFLLPILFVAMIHPPRRIAAFMGFVAIAMAAPFAYHGWDADAAGATFATFVIWAILAVLGNLLMSGVRAQRLQLTAEEAEARREARVDKLTGLHNRRGFDEALAYEVERARRQGTSLTVAMVDINSFKVINDGWGHAEGDRCLREVAEAVSGSLRQPDLCFRWGGDEFALILTGTAAADATALGARLKGVVYSRCRRPDSEPMEISFAVAELAEGMSADELNAMAGMALTAAKAEDKLGADVDEPY